MAIAEVTPNAFNGLNATHWYETFPDLVYFSFVSLTTLGYGDIGPVAPLARFLAFMEAMLGQLYIAIVVASLVGIRIAGYPEADENLSGNRGMNTLRGSLRKGTARQDLGGPDGPKHN